MLAREKVSRSANTEDVCHSKESEYLREKKTMSPSMQNAKAKKTTYVKSDVDPHESKVAPMMIEENIRIRLQELVCGPVRAELTTARGVRIREVATEIVNELAHVLLASLARRRLDCYIFDRCAGYLRVPQR